MTFILSSPLPLFQENAKKGNIHQSFVNSRHNIRQNNSTSNHSFSMRSNSNRKPIFGQNSRNLIKTDIKTNTDPKARQKAYRRDIFDRKQEIIPKKLLDSRIGNKTGGTYRQRLNQARNNRQFDQNLKIEQKFETEDEQFIYRPYNTGHVTRKRVIYINEPENIEINYDYCGCESKVVPCAILQSVFLNKISIDQMKKQYLRTFELFDMKKRNLDRSNQQIRQFLSFLPKNFPQIFLSQLRNLEPLLSHNSKPLQLSEFILLSWIQYHTKIQYITYFLFQQLRRSLQAYSPDIYLIELQRQLIKQSGHADIKAQIYSNLLRESQRFDDFKSQSQRLGKKEVIEKFQNFLDEFLISGASILVPITYYARFLNVYKKKKGLAGIVGVIASIMLIDRGGQIMRVIKIWEEKDYGRYWSLIRGWDWQQIFDKILK